MPRLEHAEHCGTPLHLDWGTAQTDRNARSAALGDNGLRSRRESARALPSGGLCYTAAVSS